MLEQIITDYYEAIVDTDRDRAFEVVRQAEERGVSPEDIVFRVVLPAMDLMVKSVSESSQINLAQHFMTAQIADAVTAEMLKRFKCTPQINGRIVIGAPTGDMHTLGKRIVIGCLRARMMDVTDLGVNVPAVRFVEEATAHQAEVIAISAMMVHTARGENGCLKVRGLLQAGGLEHKVKIIVGGAPFRFDHELFKTIGADAWAEDAVSAGPVVEYLIKEVRRA